MVKKKKVVENSKPVVEPEFPDDVVFGTSGTSGLAEDFNLNRNELDDAFIEDISKRVHELKKRMDSIQEDVNLLIKHAMPNGELGKRFYKFVKDNAFNRKCKDTFKVWAG
jgi:hypothetical protein|tara:strand:- start:103 stop:432 length:330 start_codon:yes stop_codon:yes gene_type:complete